MATGKRPQKKTGGMRHAHAQYLTVKNGEKHTCTKAGEIFGCPGHRTYAHQPCPFALTDGALQCAFCAAGVETVFRAYVPMWDLDWALRYVLIGEDIFDSVDAIPFRSPVHCLRAKNPIAPLIVRQVVSQEREPPDREPWNKPVNMLAVCLTLWKDGPLMKWFEKECQETNSDNGLSLLKSDGQPFGAMTAAAARRFAPPATKEAVHPVDGEIARLVNHAKRVSGNGNGKKPH
jgi:hypothetical protein